MSNGSIHAPVVITTQFPEGAPQGVVTPGNLVNAFVAGVEGIRLTLVNLRMSLTRAVADYAVKPVRAAIAIAAIIAATVALNAIYTAVKGNAEAMIVVAFLQGLWKTVLTIGSFFQVDTIITLIRLGDMFIDSFHVELAKIYTALGALSGELSKDMSFIMVFTETSRAIMHTAYAISGNAWLKGEVAFADSMAGWLGGLKDKFDSYMRNPEQIFIDIQRSVSAAAKAELDDRVAGIFAAIDLVADTARKTGDEIISLLDELDRIKKNAPDEIQAAMDIWYKPFREDYDKFINDRWDPFWAKTDQAMEIVSDLIEAHGIDIEEIKKTIKTPYDFFMVIFGLPTQEQAAEIKRTRDIMLKLLEDTTVDADAFGNTHRAKLAASADPLDVTYLPSGPAYVQTESYRVPASIQTDQNNSWYRGAY